MEPLSRPSDPADRPGRAERSDPARRSDPGRGSDPVRQKDPSAFRSFARGAVAAASFAALERLATYAGWAGYGEGRSRLALGLAVAGTVGAVVAPFWSLWFPRARASLAVSLIAFAGLALLLRMPALLHPTGVAWLDAGIVCLLPVLPLAAHLDRRWTSPGLAVAGAAVAILLDGLVLAPRIGLGLSLGVWAVLWALAERGAWDAPDESQRSSAANLVGLLAAGVAVGAAIAVARPFLPQHMPADPLGDLTFSASAAVIAAVGWLLAGPLARALGGRWTAAIGGALFLAGCAAAWLAATVVSWRRGPDWLGPLHDATSSPARTALALWAFVALPSAACGLIAKGVWTRGARAVAACVLGVAAGTLLAEQKLLPALDSGGSLETAAQSRVRIPPLVAPSAFALNAEGTRFRYPMYSAGESIEMTLWRGIQRGRERTWSRLETREVLEPRAPEATTDSSEDSKGKDGRDIAGLLCIGSVQPAHAVALGESERRSVLFLDPLPSLDDRAERGRNPLSIAAWKGLPAPAVVVLSEATLSASGALAGTREALADLASKLRPSTALWIWCDPRALRPDGVRTVLATWRATFPGARVHVLLDRYAGPLIGLHVGAGPDGSKDLESLEIARVAVEDLRTGDAGLASLDRPILESQSKPGPPHFDHPDAETIRALADALGLAPGHAALGLLDSLARHAAAQEYRRVLTPAEDKIRVAPGELDALRDAVRSDPTYAPAVQQAENVAAYLYKKREYDVLLNWTRELVAARPDVGAFHRYLALALLELLDKPGAIAEMELAVSLSPESTDARAELSKLYADAGRHAEALRLLETVWQERPTTEIAKGLGLSYLKVEDYTRARQYLEYARAQAPADGEVAHALEQLTESGH